ncbi:hypothetical protein KCV00_g85, partial [Aureobasidium melanogenum]
LPLSLSFFNLCIGVWSTSIASSSSLAMLCGLLPPSSSLSSSASLMAFCNLAILRLMTGSLCISARVSSF